MCVCVGGGGGGGGGTRYVFYFIQYDVILNEDSAGNFHFGIFWLFPGENEMQRLVNFQNGISPLY